MSDIHKTPEFDGTEINKDLCSHDDFDIELYIIQLIAVFFYFKRQKSSVSKTNYPVGLFLYPKREKKNERYNIKNNNKTEIEPIDYFYPSSMPINGCINLPKDTMVNGSKKICKNSY